MIYEIRKYTIKHGKRAEWVRLMEEEIIPFQVSKGVVVAASFVSLEDESTYVWIRRFADEDELTELKKAVYQSDAWNSDFVPKIEEMLDQEAIEVMKLMPTPKSVLH